MKSFKGPAFKSLRYLSSKEILDFNLRVLEIREIFKALRINLLVVGDIVTNNKGDILRQLSQFDVFHVISHREL